VSNEIQKFNDPGLPVHIHRKADTDPVAAKRAEQQVAVLFLLSAVGTVVLIGSYIFVKSTTFIYLPILGDTNLQQLLLGVGMAASLFFIGMGAVQWARKLMSDTEADFVTTVKEQAGTVGLGRRSLIKRTLGISLGLAGLSPLILLRDLGPLPKNQLSTTSWKAGTRLVTDPGNRPIKPSDLEVGAVAQVLPELPAGTERTLENIGKDAVLLIRLRPEDFQLTAQRLSWTYEGIIAFFQDLLPHGMRSGVVRATN
jgi:ubiquinol-cytochrome c reductase iron-sulfur subunit